VTTPTEVNPGLTLTVLPPEEPIEVVAMANTAVVVRDIVAEDTKKTGKAQEKQGPK